MRLGGERARLLSARQVVIKNNQLDRYSKRATLAVRKKWAKHTESRSMEGYTESFRDGLLRRNEALSRELCQALSVTPHPVTVSCHSLSQ
jgi:hypothetical protein